MRWLVLSLVVALGVVAVGQAARPVVVLGKHHLLRGGVGWGTAHPARIFNGGDPSGTAWNLRWRHWGGPQADAAGLTWIFRPQGGYYAKPAAIELQAYRLGHCAVGGPLAYTRLRARVASRPGGPLGRWFAWGGWKTICRWPS